MIILKISLTWSVTNSGCITFSENYDIYKFVTDTTVELRLTSSKNWNDIIASGKLELLQINKDFKNDPFFEFDKNTAHIVQMETVNVYMFCFSNDIKPFYLKTKTGFKFDQEIRTETLDLWKYNSVFFPENWYFNSNTLPIEWLEMFEKKEELIRIEENDILKDYKPFLNKFEGDFVVEPASFLNRTVLATRKPMSDYSWFSFNKVPNPLDKWVLDKTYNPSKFDILEEDESQGKEK